MKSDKMKVQRIQDHSIRNVLHLHFDTIKSQPG